MSIKLTGLSIGAGSFRRDGLNLDVGDGEYAVLMGRTGSGKTTLLETICGLTPARAGTIELDGIDATHARPGERGVGYVPQDGALFPSMNVREHLRFALRVQGWPRLAARARLSELAAALGIEGLLSRRPRGLSGGERQRVALGRALAARPAVLLLDEPVSALDEDSREELYDVLTALRDQRTVTTLHVTHSLTEARRLGQTHYRLGDRLERIATSRTTPESGRA